LTRVSENSMRRKRFSPGVLHRDNDTLEKTEGILLLSFLTLFCFSLLFLFRSFDNNTLTSWQWVFGNGEFTKILPYLCAAIVLSLLISLYIPLEKHPQPVLIVVAGLSVIPLWSAPELLLDSGRYFLQAKSLAVSGPAFFFREWGHAVTAWTDLPLSPFLYGLILKYGNESRTAVQLFNTIIFILTVLLTCRIGTLLWTRELGFYAGLLLTGIPYLLTQVPQMLVDLHAMFFHVLAVYCFLLAIKSTDYPALALSSLTLVLAALVKFSLWPCWPSCLWDPWSFIRAVVLHPGSGGLFSFCCRPRSCYSS
jgi:hypothetical protein